MSEQLQLGVMQFDRWRELDATVTEALGSPLLSECEREILRVIAGHKGAQNAIRGEEVAERTGVPWGENARRRIAGVVETAVLLFGIPVGGLRVKPYGYFLIVTSKDLEMALQPLQSEFYALLRRLRALTSRQDAARMFGQAMLKLDQEATTR